jgi:hypothetical protein
MISKIKHLLNQRDDIRVDLVMYGVLIVYAVLSVLEVF